MPESAQSSYTRYFQVETRDSVGKSVVMFAAWRNGQAVLFFLNGGIADVMYLLDVLFADDLRAVISSHITDVSNITELPGRPDIQGVQLGRSQSWTPMQMGIIGVILETKII